MKNRKYKIGDKVIIKDGINLYNTPKGVCTVKSYSSCLYPDFAENPAVCLIESNMLWYESSLLPASDLALALFGVNK